MSTYIHKIQIGEVIIIGRSSHLKMIHKNGGGTIYVPVITDWNFEDNGDDFYNVNSGEISFSFYVGESYDCFKEAGICYSTSYNPTINNNKYIVYSESGIDFNPSFKGIVNSDFRTGVGGINVIKNTSYHIRGYVTNAFGTTYTNDRILLIGDLFIDNISFIDKYSMCTTQKIGDQLWIKHNWSSLYTRTETEILDINYPGGEENKDVNVPIYGLQYTFDDANLLTSTGWHLPSAVEYELLKTTIGTTSTVGNDIKENGTIHWNSPSVGNNSTLLYGRGAGVDEGTLKETSIFWTSIETDDDHATVYTLSHDNTVFNSSNIDKTTHASVRLLAGVPLIPVAITYAATNITKSTALLNGTVNASGSGTTVTFQYGTTKSYGSEVTASQSPVTGTLNTSVSINATSLANNTLYHFRTKANNPYAIIYGDDLEFTTLPDTNLIIDLDGNVYTSVVIGTQTWMVENWKCTHYRDGTSIIPATSMSEWSIRGNYGTGSYCWYNNSITNKTPYGALYNAYAINNIHNIAPSGWHVPTDNEIATLLTYIGGNQSSGKLKETGFSHWNTPNEGATNETLFTGVPGGYRNTNGSFAGLHIYNFNFTNIANSNTQCIYYFNYLNQAIPVVFINMTIGCSVRLIKN